jgi:hypothetical protein
MPDLKSERSFRLVVVILFAALTGAAYFPAFAGKVPFPRDMLLQFSAWSGMARSEAWQHYADIGDLVTAFYPARVFAARAVREGTLPLWNPYILGGAPFLASAQPSLFYPPNFLYYVLSTPAAWTLCFMLRMFLSGVFTTLFVRSIGGSRAGSYFAGIVFALCGFMTAWQGQPMDDAATWLPFVCYAITRLQARPSGGALSLAAFGFAMPVLAGHPETAAHVTLAGILIGVFMWICSRFDVRFLLRFACAAFLAIALSSIQIIPTLEWLAQMPSALDLRWPVLTPHDLLAWVSRDIVRAPNSAGLWIPESAAYVGMITLLVAPIGLLHRNRRHGLFLAGLTILALAIAYGFGPVHWLIDRTPVLAGLKNGRMIFIASFGLAALAGLGISVLEEQIPFKPGRRAVAMGLVSLAFLLTLFLVYKLQLATGFRVEFTRRPSFSRALLLVSVVFVLWRVFGGLRGRFFPIAACALIIFDLLTFSYGYTGFVKRDEIYPPASLFDFLRQTGDPARFRIATLGLPFPSNANMVYGLASADGYEVRMISRQIAFSSDYVDKTFPGISLVSSRFRQLNDRRLDMMNLKYIAAGSRSPEFQELMSSPRFSIAWNNGYVALFENKSVLPRAYAVPAGGIQVVAEMDRQLDRLRDPAFDPERTVIVSSPVHIADSERPASTGKVEITDSRINDLYLHAEASEPSVLVISQTHYPGWEATLDGRPAELFPVNVTLTGIALPAGVHEVGLAFRPRSVRIGALISLAAGIVLIVLAIKDSKGRLLSSVVL